MVDAAEVFCSDFCMCVNFTLPSSKRKQLDKKLESKEYHKKYKSELRKTDLKVTGKIRLGFPRSGGEGRGFIISLEPDNTLSDKDFRKIFTIFQKRVEVLETKFGLKKFEGMTCTAFSFSSSKFKPVGELSLPANLVLRTDLMERVGKPELHGFKIAFKESPIGMERAYVELSDGRLSVRIVSAYKFTQIENIIKKTFAYAKQLASLFVEESKK